MLPSGLRFLVPHAYIFWQLNTFRLLELGLDFRSLCVQMKLDQDMVFCPNHLFRGIGGKSFTYQVNILMLYIHNCSVLLCHKHNGKQNLAKLDLHAFRSNRAAAHRECNHMFLLVPEPIFSATGVDQRFDHGMYGLTFYQRAPLCFVLQFNF